MLRIAVATLDGHAVDEHFGRCPRFDVYDLDATTAVLAETRTVPATAPGEGAVDARLAAVRDCAVVHLVSIGPSAAARVVAAGVMPVTVPEGTPVADVVDRLRTVLQGTPPPWLRKALARGARPAWSPS